MCKDLPARMYSETYLIEKEKKKNPEMPLTKK